MKKELNKLKQLMKDLPKEPLYDAAKIVVGRKPRIYDAELAKYLGCSWEMAHSLLTRVQKEHPKFQKIREIRDRVHKLNREIEAIQDEIRRESLKEQKDPKAEVIMLMENGIAKTHIADVVGVSRTTLNKIIESLPKI